MRGFYFRFFGNQFFIHEDADLFYFRIGKNKERLSEYGVAVITKLFEEELKDLVFYNAYKLDSWDSVGDKVYYFLFLEKPTSVEE